jgi:hypothetical protein
VSSIRVLPPIGASSTSACTAIPAGDRQRCRGRVRNTVGNLGKPVRADRQELGATPLTPEGIERPEHALADEMRDRAATDTDHVTGKIAAEPAWRPLEDRDEAQLAVAALVVERIQARGAHAHLDFAVSR